MNGAIRTLIHSDPAGPLRSSARSGQVAGAGGLPCGVDWVAPEVPAAVAVRAVRYLAAAALACLSALRRGVRAPPVLALPAPCLAQGDAPWDSSGGRCHECLPHPGTRATRRCGELLAACPSARAHDRASPGGRSKSPAVARAHHGGQAQNVASSVPTGLQPSGRTPALLSALNTPRLSTTDRHTPIRTPNVAST
jgi:hypothetical protein